MEYQVQMVYEREDVSALVRTLDFRRRPEKNLRRARKIGYRVFGVLLIAVAVFTVGAMVYAGVFCPHRHRHRDHCSVLPPGRGGPPSPV